jgi:hypothetical protein
MEPDNIGCSVWPTDLPTYADLFLYTRLIVCRARTLPLHRKRLVEVGTLVGLCSCPLTNWG